MTGPTISLTVPFSLDITEESEPQKADVPRVVPLPDCGGIPGFQSRKRPAEMIIESQLTKEVFRCTRFASFADHRTACDTNMPDTY